MNDPTSVIDAKKCLDSVIKKSRTHFYKPIQVAETLYKYRTGELSNLLNLDLYRTKSKTWRDAITSILVGRTSTSSAKYQDDLFENALPPHILAVLGEENNLKDGAVEAYIYKKFNQKHSQLENALNYCLDSDVTSFNVKTFIDSFWNEPGLKRSIDKIYEIIVYALFETLVEALNLKVEVSIDEKSEYLLEDFYDFAEMVMLINFQSPTHNQNGRIYRVGVTNAADRGIDIYANWGPIIQIKHLSLDKELAENIVSSVSSDRIIIVCKDAEESVINSILAGVGAQERIQSIITENNLIKWYEKALRGNYALQIAPSLLNILAMEIRKEFPSTGSSTFQNPCIAQRHYENIHDEFWI